MSDLSRKQEQALNDIEESFRESVETVFQTGINPEAQINLVKITGFDRDFFQERFLEGLVLVKIPHKNPSSGDERFLFSNQTAAHLSDLMVMGDGTAEFNPDEHIDAMQEIVDQVYGAFASSNKGSISADLNYSLAEATFGDSSLLDEVDDSWVAVEFAMELEQGHQFYHLISPQALDNFLGGGKQAEEPEVLPMEEEASPIRKPKAAQPAPKAAEFQSFGAEPAERPQTKDIEMLMDLRLPIVIELGRTTMFIKDILKLSSGSIIELDKLSGDPVDIYVNEKKFAEGEVVVIDENFGVRITELIKPEERVRKLS